MSRHKILLGCGALLALMWVTVWGDGLSSVLWMQSASAQFTAAQADDMINGIGVVVGIILTVLHVGMWIIFRLLDIVLDPAFLFDLPEYGGTGALYEMIHQIWILSRDLVNVCFALILIATALYVVITTKKGFVTEHAPKFVMAVVFVNFSWFVPQVLLDVSQVTTYTVFQIPSLIGGGPGGPDCMVHKAELVDPANPQAPANFEKCSIVTKVLFFEEINNRTDNELENETPENDDWHCPLASMLCYQTLPWDEPGLAASPESRVINGLIVNHARLKFLISAVDRPAGAVAGNPNETVRLFTYLIKMILVLVINIALFFPMLAMLAAFFVRIPILWITMAFMPFVFLEFVYGKPLTANFNMTEKIWKGFLSAAFLPTMAGIPLSVGFILINAGSQVQWPSAIDAKLSGTLPLLSGVHSLWQIIWLLMALLILWVGVFTALKSNEYTGKVVEGIQQQGQALGKFVATSPMYVPFLPAPGGGTQSVQGAMEAHGKPSDWLNRMEASNDVFDAAGAALRGDINASGQRAATARQAFERPQVKQNFQNTINNTFFSGSDQDRIAAIQGLRANATNKDVFRQGAQAAADAIAAEMNIRDADQQRKLREAIEAAEQAPQGGGGGQGGGTP